MVVNTTSTSTSTSDQPPYELDREIARSFLKDWARDQEQPITAEAHEALFAGMDLFWLAHYKVADNEAGVRRSQDAAIYWGHLVDDILRELGVPFEPYGG